jgi:redox-sensitive bicupin YhaK (pirin superfamily)
MSPTLEILHRDDIPRGGFAGLREHRLVMDPSAWGPYANPTAWPGLGSFVYLADARFQPHGDTQLHPHREIDVISVMVEGRIAHEGSLGDGAQIAAPDVQVQRAGAEGFTHNEVNPDDTENRMIQLWALPENEGESAGYKLYHPQWGAATRVYGGPAGQTETFAGQTVIDVVLLKKGEPYSLPGEFMAYLTKGNGRVKNQSGGRPGAEVKDGDLLRGRDLEFQAENDTELIAVHLLPK